MDGVIAANKNNIICFSENSLLTDNGEESLYHSNQIYIGRILTEKNHADADTYWHYTKKEWNELNKRFNLLQSRELKKAKSKS